MPVTFPSTSLAAAPGSPVLAPPRRWIDSAVERGSSTQPFVFFAGQLRKAGAQSSWIVTRGGTEEEIPNAMILPIRAGQGAPPGSVVLTDWAAGTGMQRAWVVEGGSPAQPRVHYLDLPQDQAQESVELAANSFHPLTQPGEPGTSLACQEANRWIRVTVITVAEGQVLSLGFAGKLAVFPLASCIALPIVPRLENGAAVQAPRLGIMSAGKVHQVDRTLGRVRVRFPVGHGEEEISIPFGHLLATREMEPVAASLPSASATPARAARDR